MIEEIEEEIGEEGRCAGVRFCDSRLKMCSFHRVSFARSMV